MLHWAANKNDTPIIKDVLGSLRSDGTTLKDVVLATNKDGKTALQLAAKKGHSKAIQQLLDCVKDPGILKDLVVFPEKEGGYTVL
jgi:ankyrin repeat protein